MENLERAIELLLEANEDVLSEEQLGKILEIVIANADKEIKDGRIIELTLEAIKKCEE